MFCLCIPVLAMSQQKPLVVAGTSPRPYLTHTVAPKENYYSIGRLYNISPKEIAPFNNLELEKGLSLSQTIRIPLLETNFVQANGAAANESLIPVYHSIKEKENLSQISGLYNKVPIESIKTWNNLKGESLSAGNKIIIGYLRVNSELSALAAGNKVPATIVNPAPTPKPVPVEPKAVSPSTKPDISNETLPVVKKPQTTEPPEKKPEKEKPSTGTKVESAVTKKESTAPVEPVRADPPVTAPSGKSFDGGSFRSVYESQARKKSPASESGTAAVFKSTSGWEDGKYYCLHNSVNPGTIVKVTNKANGKSVYAKVLDVMPDIRQNNDLIIRISNAAAQELGVSEPKFDCTLSIPN